MGNWKCVPRKKRRDPLINKTSTLFNNALIAADYELAARIVYFTVLKLFGKKGIINTLDDANRYILRKERRRGL